LDYYTTLGVRYTANAGEIKQAYLKLVKIYHPDRNKSPDATKTMAEINRAYETLSDSHKRRRYDRENKIVPESNKVPVYNEDNELIGQKSTKGFGKCVKCNFVNSSGMFVCSVCGYRFDPIHKNDKRAEQYYDNDDDINIEDIDNGEEDKQDSMSEIIRCPQCNEVNLYSRGSCWQCGIDFKIYENA
jgi:DnaJ-class molecular chaperone